MNYINKIQTLALILQEISKTKIAIYDQIMPGYIARKFEHISDQSILNICPFLGQDNRIWDWLPKPTQIRVQQLLKDSPVETLEFYSVSDAFSIDALRNTILNKIRTSDHETSFKIFFEMAKYAHTNPNHDHSFLVKTAIDFYSKSHDFRDAERRGHSTVGLFVKFFKLEDIEALLAAVEGNYEIWGAFGTPKLLMTIFEVTSKFLPQSQQYWEPFIKRRTETDGELDEYSPYFGLRKLLEANR